MIEKKSRSRDERRRVKVDWVGRTRKKKIECKPSIVTDRLYCIPLAQRIDLSLKPCRPRRPKDLLRAGLAVSCPTIVRQQSIIYSISLALGSSLGFLQLADSSPLG